MSSSSESFEILLSWCAFLVSISNAILASGDCATCSASATTDTSSALETSATTLMFSSSQRAPRATAAATAASSGDGRSRSAARLSSVCAERLRFSDACVESPPPRSQYCAGSRLRSPRAPPGSHHAPCPPWCPRRNRRALSVTCGST